MTEVAIPRWPETKMVGRCGDMTPPGDSTLTVLLQQDGDVIVEVYQRKDNGERERAEVEFCAPGAGAGRSPRVRAALIGLMVAIEEDNRERADLAWPRHG